MVARLFASIKSDMPRSTFDRLVGALTEYGMRVGEKLRSYGRAASRLTAFSHTDPSEPERPQYTRSRTVTATWPWRARDVPVQYGILSSGRNDRRIKPWIKHSG